MKPAPKVSPQKSVPAAPDVHTHCTHTQRIEKESPEMNVIAIIAAVLVAGGAILSGGSVAYAKADAVYDRAATQSRIASFMGN